jgi:hypothetical protein
MEEGSCCGQNSKKTKEEYPKNGRPVHGPNGLVENPTMRNSASENFFVLLREMRGLCDYLKQNS